MANENKSREDKHKQQDVEIKETLRQIKNKILVMSGKGGVGKSSIAAYLSVALAKRGYRVGLMDVDLHGPSIPRMLGLEGSLGPGSGEGKPHPIGYIPNMEVISIEPLMGENKDAATIWRGPLKIGVIRQFIADIEWMDLDYMIEISLADVRKSINFCRQVNMVILGIVENMSGLKCPYCGEMIDIFKTRGGMLTAKKEGLRLLGTLPFEPDVVSKGDTGSMSLLDDNKLLLTKEFNKIVDEIVKLTGTGAEPVPELKKKSPGRKKRSADTKVLVVPVSGGKLSAHFGHCEQFAFIETQNGKITKTEMLNPPSHEPGALPRWLHEQGADVAIVGGMGESAQQLLREKGIEVIIGAPMDSPESLANQYLSDTLVSGANVCDH
jgi:Mrp family chromosome partitioning ATPase/predicted Fe-Mo cluster-binding NifX family protein